jgi:hypothetical protein
MRAAPFGKAQRMNVSTKEYGSAPLERYPDSAFFLPISLDAQIFVHPCAQSAVRWIEGSDVEATWQNIQN